MHAHLDQVGRKPAQYVRLYPSLRINRRDEIWKHAVEISHAWSLEHPERFGRKFDIVIARLKWCHRVCTHCDVVTRKHEFPALAEVHRRLELHLHPVGSGT